MAVKQGEIEGKYRQSTIWTDDTRRWTEGGLPGE